ncbi:MAG: small multi-drug export protein [Gammaproteobacteria bacterium]
MFKTTEGRILWLGIAIACLGLIAMAVIAFWAPGLSTMIGAMSVSNIVFGRVASMSIGFAGGYGQILVILVNCWIETVLVLLFYPLFVLSMNRLLVFPRLKRFLDNTRAVAEHEQVKVRRYGIIGLFVFVWFPFWMTGPVVGSAIGYLLGFSPVLTVSVVLGSTFLAIAAWSYFLFDLYAQAMQFATWAPAVIIGIIILNVAAGYWLNRRGRRWNKKS